MWSAIVELPYFPQGCFPLLAYSLWTSVGFLRVFTAEMCEFSRRSEDGWYIRKVLDLGGSASFPFLKVSIA